MPNVRKTVNPSRVCKCGCGKQTPNVYSYYIHGHEHRKSIVDYIVEDHGYETPCWVWQLAINTHGYGSIRRGKTNIGAHRVWYESHKGPIPEGMQIDHLCRNRACVNPAHLEAVTPRENIRRGKHHHEWLPDESREEICRLYSEGGITQSELATRFGVTQGAISQIVLKRGVNHHEMNRARGERGGNSKLTAAQVEQMRDECSDGIPMRDLSAKYGVAVQTVTSICLRRTWKHVT